MNNADIFRISIKEYATDISVLLNGMGGVRTDGRWHIKGARVAYFTSSRALALLEKLVHLNAHPNDMANGWVAAKLSLPEYMSSAKHIRFITAEEMNKLDKHWRKQYNQTCIKVGATWYNDADQIILKVPSAIIPQEYNTVINCGHKMIENIVAEATLQTDRIAIDDRIVELIDRKIFEERRGR